MVKAINVAAQLESLMMRFSDLQVGYNGTISSVELFVTAESERGGQSKIDGGNRGAVVKE